MAAPKGTKKWLLAHVSYQGDDCLTWPFGRDNKGYGMFKWGDKMRKPHRVMCELVNGPPPTPTHEAAHSCGKGHEGCVNPRHLSWKTRSENQLDRRKHGTQANAWWCGKGKLTPRQVLEIRSLKGQKTEWELAAMYGCTPTNINKIHNGQRWKSLLPRTE